MKYIGKIDKNKIGKYKDKVTTYDVIITNERIKHIQTRHPGDYEKYISYISDIIENPDYILEDKDNIDTMLFLKTMKYENKKIQVVIKLQTNNEKDSMSNSILTFWQIRDRNYKSTIKNNKIIYKNIDKNE